MTANPTLDAAEFNRKIILSDEVLLQEVCGESVLLDLRSERYFGLNEVGTRLWQLLAQDASLRGAYEVLLGEYEVEPQRLGTDVLSVIRELSDAGLVSIS